MTGRGGAKIQPPDPWHKVIPPSLEREVDSKGNGKSFWAHCHRWKVLSY